MMESRPCPGSASVCRCGSTGLDRTIDGYDRLAMAVFLRCALSCEREVSPTISRPGDDVR
jgi:hypothetical protein